MANTSYGFERLPELTERQYVLHTIVMKSTGSCRANNPLFSLQHFSRWVCVRNTPMPPENVISSSSPGAVGHCHAFLTLVCNFSDL